MCVACALPALRLRRLSVARSAPLSGTAFCFVMSILLTHLFLPMVVHALLVILGCLCGLIVSEVTDKLYDGTILKIVLTNL